MTIRGYTATRDDGILTIANVPIFLECQKGDAVFDKAWIKEAVKQAKLAAKDGYHPPLHIRHHEMATELNDSVRPAGFFRITKTGTITFKGEKKLAVFADLVITDPGAEYEVLAKRLPYRSVEIFDVEKPGLNSLALLDHEAPFLELPMLLIEEVVEVDVDKYGVDIVEPLRSSIFANAKTFNPWLAKNASPDDRVVACFRRGAAAVLITQETDMADQSATIDNPDTAQPAGETPAEGANLAAEGPPFERKDGGEGSDAEGAEAAAESTDPDSDGDCEQVGAVVQAIADGSISIADFAAIREAMAAQEGADPQQPQQPQQQQRPMMNSPAPAAAPGGEAMSAETKTTMTDTEATLRGRVDALEADAAARDAADKRKSDVKAAMLRLEGRPLGENFAAKLDDMHVAGGPAAFEKYVDSIVATFGALPNSGESAERFAAQTTNVPKVAMKYQGTGTDAVAKAVKFSQEWSQLSEAGATSLTEARYVELNMSKEGVTADETPQ